MCAAPKGNKFWMNATATGRPAKFDSPQQLWELACDYFEETIKNPLKEQKVFGTGKRMTVKVMRPFTIKGLCIHLNIGDNTWHRYRRADDYKDFWDVTERIENIIYVQKFEGASANLLNQNIIARDLGLVDKTDITSRGKSLQTQSPVINIHNHSSELPVAEDEEDES